MAFIPQELINYIIWQLDDKDCLRACSLVSCNFREPSQRSLFPSLDLGRSVRTHEAAASLLAESPHIGSYVRKLSIQLAPSDAPSNGRGVESLRAVLDRLPNVTQCTVRGDAFGCRWDGIKSHGSALLEFIERNKVAELRVLFMKDIPLPVLARIVATPRIVSFYHVVWNGGEHRGELAEVFACSSPAMEQLRLEQSDSIGILLARPEFAIHRARLRRLGLELKPDNALLTAGSATVDHVPSLAFLPALRSIDVGVQRYDDGTHWFQDTLAAFLASSPPGLEELGITHLPMALRSPPKPPKMRPVTLTAIDDLLAPTAVRLRWRISFTGPGDTGQRTQCLAEFAGTLQAGMPRLHAAGQLIVASDALGGDRGEWAFKLPHQLRSSYYTVA
ncbi:hypothetical protein B0H11DRAFT_2209166 [Mycena galericulata]|nr:hypothetical protein B0H11DRAFT_2209166 [Mycena galericulata]